MGLFDNMAGELGQMLGGQAQGQTGQTSPLEIVSTLLASSGGISGLVQQFQQGGLGEVVQSWIGNGANLPVSGAQLQQILGSGALGEIASKLGVSQDHAADALAQTLPQTVDALTPNGQIPSETDLAAQAQNLLGKLFG